MGLGLGILDSDVSEVLTESGSNIIKLNIGDFFFRRDELEIISLTVASTPTDYLDSRRVQGPDQLVCCRNTR